MAGVKKNITVSKINTHGDIERSKDHPAGEEEHEWDKIPPEYYSLGLYLVIPLLLGLAAGIFLDKKWGTGYGWTLTGLTIGMVSVFYNLYTLYSKDGSTHKHKR